MKNIFNMRVFIIFIASVVFVSCSKENLYSGKSGETINTSKMRPAYNYGGISGTLVPAPYYAALKFYNDDENFSTSCFADLKGDFKIGDLIPGIYRIIVIYIPYNQGSSPAGEFRYFEIRGIIVEPGMVNELGEIFLK